MGTSHECLASFCAEAKTNPENAVTDVAVIIARAIPSAYDHSSCSLRHILSSLIQVSLRPMRMYTRIPRNIYMRGTKMALIAMVKSRSGDRFVKFGMIPGGGALEGVC